MIIHDIYQKSFETICGICDDKTKIIYEPCTSFYKDYYYITVILFSLTMGYFGLKFLDSQVFRDFIFKSNVEPKPIQLKTKNHIIKKRRFNYVNLPINPEAGPAAVHVPNGDESSGIGSDDNVLI
jgi:hypothetical protein